MIYGKPLFKINKRTNRLTGATISAYDPEAMDNVKREIGDKISYAENQYDALEDADALVDRH